MATTLSRTTHLENKARPFTVIVEGNIGSGKTTFLNYFKKYEDLCVLAEPIELWRECSGHNLLQYLYEDINRWGFSFQSYVMLSMLKHHLKITEHPIKMMERSIFSARYCFIEKMKMDGLLPSPSHAVLDEWFKWITASCNVSVDLIVYLRTSPEVVYERMLQRNRKEEKNVSLDYLKQLHEIHEDWLYRRSIFSCPAPVVTLNANLDQSVLKEEYKKWEPCILNKIQVSI
ncbi:deoxynucleoside kinase [Agrilus planipennis]|uniref:Deoxynucleoside kinase n=1 Tax=Agrilus planipennis TaxID=224129 RepID=A0A1W4X2M2_AGRPL|nr:deoxynucleoside kinase [Agrilus planipennis]